ncbi:MAG: transposase family protein [Deltaproteobacteria bacterium]|nr:transposase family protein [Deltaproteobacteria bacterium]
MCRAAGPRGIGPRRTSRRKSSASTSTSPSSAPASSCAWRSASSPFRAARETFRQIVIRRRELVVELEDARRRRPRRIHVTRPGSLWGIFLTLVWVLGFWPVWVLGAVDYHGSRLVAFERVGWPSAHAVTRALSRAFDQQGAPARLLTDRGPAFTATTLADLCAARGVRQVLIRPGHCWTNGRIERVFRTFKQTVFGLIWLFASTREIDRYCGDFRR